MVVAVLVAYLVFDDVMFCERVCACVSSVELAGVFTLIYTHETAAKKKGIVLFHFPPSLSRDFL